MAAAAENGKPSATAKRSAEEDEPAMSHHKCGAPRPQSSIRSSSCTSERARRILTGSRAAQVLPLLPAREDPQQQHAGLPEPVVHASLLPTLPVDAPRRRGRDGKLVLLAIATSSRCKGNFEVQPAPRWCRKVDQDERMPGSPVGQAENDNTSPPWYCPICRNKCCCAKTECTESHRHCKAYRYRCSRAEKSIKRAR
jgi:hypothetical protein